MNIHIGDEIELLGGELLSQFWVAGDDFAFPSADWSEFVYPLLCTWSDELLNHLNSSNARYTLYYWTGPYCIKVVQNEYKRLELKFTKDGKCCHTETMSYGELAEMFYAALQRIRALLYENQLTQTAEYQLTLQKISDRMRALKNVMLNNG